MLHVQHDIPYKSANVLFLSVAVAVSVALNVVAAFNWLSQKSNQSIYSDLPQALEIGSFKSRLVLLLTGEKAG